MSRPTSNLVHGFFGLSYSNYLVLHRSLLQSMPDDWQVRFVDCINELEASFRHIEHAPGYDVRAAKSVPAIDLSEDEMKLLGITSEIRNESTIHEELIYRDEDGNELTAHDRVMVPTGEDPIPHYARGRTYIEPRP